jgi:protein-S-isoprenylcysteine O-methyltransferase Ste14
MKTLFIALRSAVFGASFISLWGWVAWSLHLRYDSTLGFALPAWTRALGIALLAAGGTLALACIATFVTRGEGTPAPFDPPRKFVAAGPYKFVRNPMYRWLHHALRLRAIRTLARDSALRTALAPVRSFLRHSLRRAASPRHLWRAL